MHVTFLWTLVNLHNSYTLSHTKQVTNHYSLPHLHLYIAYISTCIKIYLSTKVKTKPINYIACLKLYEFGSHVNKKKGFINGKLLYLL